ncbi:MAG: nucleotidyltransferase domain-containing protein [Planctomycetes bacterium]|nr:nucleotidyltransferase domain-containing protein [Planctomycetota bacterium]
MTRPLPECAQRGLLDLVVAQLHEELGAEVTSVALYGSVARGKARPDSDIDLLVVLRHPPASYYERLRPIFEVVRQARRILAEQGRLDCPQINFLVLSEEEARQNRGIYLDMVEEAILLVDRGDFLGTKLAEMRRRLEELGAKRIAIGEGWYWNLKPALQPGETVIL